MASLDLRFDPVEGRSLLWNALARGRPGLRLAHALVRFPRAEQRRAAADALGLVGLGGLVSSPASRLDRDGRVRLALAGLLTHRPACIVFRDPDVALGLADGERILALARALVERERLWVVATVDSPALARRFGHRVIVLSEGTLVLDAAPEAFTAAEVEWRLAGPSSLRASALSGPGSSGPSGARIQPLA